MDNCTVDDVVVETYIIAAHEVIVNLFAGNTQLTTVLKKEVERWFVAHMIASTLQRTTSKEKLGDADVTYTGKWDINLLSTPYGQNCLQLDITGLMGNVGKSIVSVSAASMPHHHRHEYYGY